jgi:putative multiple sugar transport system ATP-binding protein
MANGIAYVTEDRKTYGLVLIGDIKNNVTLANLGRGANGVIERRRKEMVAQGYREQLHIRMLQRRPATWSTSPAATSRRWC